MVLTPGLTTIPLSWSPSACDGIIASYVVRYRSQRDNSAFELDTGLTAITGVVNYTVMDLCPDNAYDNFSVTSASSANTPQSPVFLGVTVSTQQGLAPPRPVALNLTGVSPSTVAVEWRDGPQCSGDESVVTHELEYTIVDGESYFLDLNRSTNTFTLGSGEGSPPSLLLCPAVQVANARLRSVDDDGLPSSWSEVAALTTTLGMLRCARVRLRRCLLTLWRLCRRCPSGCYQLLGG